MTKPVFYHNGKFPPDKIDWERLVPFMNRAHRALGSYNALLKAIPNPSIFLSPLIMREAVLSSKIEGTQVSVSDVLQYEVGKLLDDDEKVKDAAEIINYREALMMASEHIAETGMHLALLRQSHKILLKGVRGEGKGPGQFKDVQNWIGPTGCSIDDAKFIPIDPALLASGMDDWMQFYRSDYKCELVQLALTHVEFEALHPFLDGNGRLGRILIPLFLFEKNLIGSPNFYMSGYLESHEIEYKQRLNEVSEKGAWTEWCEFFLRGIEYQANENKRKVEVILELQNATVEKVKKITSSASSANITKSLISFPVFDNKRIAKNTYLSDPTISRMVKKMTDSGLVEKIREAAGNKGSIYVYWPLLEIIG